MLISNKLESIDSLSKSEEILANYILNEKENIENLSTKDLANATYTSPSTVVRLSQKLGFSGWNELKEKYIEELQYLNNHFSDVDPNFPFEAHDSFINVASKVAHLAANSIEDTLSLLKNDELKKAVDLLNKAQMINVYGSSNSLLMAYDFKHKMLRINRHVEIMNLPGEQMVVASNSSPKNCAILISYSGENEEVLKIAEMLKNKNTPTIVLTSIGENTLRSFGDCAFSISTREKLYSKIATYSSNDSIHLILDILYSCLFKINYDFNLEYKTNISKEIDPRSSTINLIKEQNEL
ncbi:MurR/RpiR family transcriptional regulator [Clostridium fungisolvens]|uniref:Putative HTH-type transcriptional regulator YbbH n=1 Tax=Clostridium fungisolvens TaxID=1604897 RepID=A0A6V8SBM5_9CLOT|nr:MurR/RpiR family transcriptional regulator [Clostridium fungisolvens]GFP74470.1 putative HTH-type transcriptional regulator YbbH [Clostridium fungisolvens]